MFLSSTDKGRQFEIEVEQWLQRQGYHDTTRNEMVRVCDNLNPFECDIHGHSYSRLWTKIKKFGTLYALWVLVMLLLNLGNARRALPQMAALYLASLALVYFGKKKTGHHVWVECKNLNGKVSRDHVHKLAGAVDRLEQYKQAEWLSQHVMIFSATDFERDALRLAKENSIDCYRKSSRGFEKVSN